MTAAETGVQLQLYPNSLTSPPANPVSLIGSSCIAAIEGPYGTIYSLPLVVFSDGTYAYRITTPTDFPIGGLYQVQLIATYVSGTILKSQQVNLTVFPSLE